MLAKLRDAQRTLVELVDEDWSMASAQSAAVQAAKLDREVAARRIIGAGVDADLVERLSAALDRDLAMVKGKPS